jgi:glycosyltransferase involved in cell wall biosynthesis
VRKPHAAELDDGASGIRAMRVVALLGVRNEQPYLERCLRHLYEQGIETCVIDNASTDGSLEICRSFCDKGVIRIEHLPFTGVFELETQLVLKERLAAEIDADWFLHCDADEIRHAPGRYATLREGIEAVDRQGYNAIDFDEFVFLPTADDESFEGRDYVEEMRHYYYFKPDSPDRDRINAWKKTGQVDLRTWAGHRVLFPGLRVWPESFLLRHYIVLSRSHAMEKYGRRLFSPGELARSWHRDRAAFRGDALRFPSKDRLKRLDTPHAFDKSEPWSEHPLFDPPPLPPERAASTARREPSERVSAVARAASNRARGIAALKQFKAAQERYIPTISPVPEGMEKPFWSVMIPTFNPRPEYFVEALESVLRQDPGAKHMQIAVVDDVTTTCDVEAIVRDAGKGRVEFYRNERNVGMAANWNACVERARGLWVHILHQDDKVLAGFYEHLRPPCEQDARIAAAFCRSAGIDESGEIKWVQEVEREIAGTLGDFAAREFATNRVMTPSIVVRRAVYEEIGGYHSGLPYCADWDLYKRAAVYSLVWYEPKCLACYRQHESSETDRLKMSAVDLSDRRKSIELSKAYLPPHLEVETSGMALKSSLLWAADILRESIAREDLPTALAQAIEIGSTLRGLADRSPGSNDHSASSPGFPASETERMQAQIDRLESQLQAWIRTAEALQAKIQAPAETRDASGGNVRDGGDGSGKGLDRDVARAGGRQRAAPTPVPNLPPRAPESPS